jgi:fatty-acyl-CoA synthase
MPAPKNFLQTSIRIARRTAVEGHAVRHAVRAGALGGSSPRTTAAILRAMQRYGPLGATIPVAALKHGDRPGLTDELGTLSFAELNKRAEALAYALRAKGLGEGTGVGILCRNHRGFVDATFGAAKIGARVLFLNTDFAGPQLREVCAREGVELLAHDQEYNELVGELGIPHRIIGWHEGESVPPTRETIEELIAANYGQQPPVPARQPATVLLTSGTTGTPKGATRSEAKTLAPLGAVLSKVPFQSGESTHVVPPMFHALGLAQLTISFALGNTAVVRRRFDPEASLQLVAENRCTAMTLVPVMLSRVCNVLEEQPGRYDTGSLRVVLAGGAQLEGEVARRALRLLGDKVYNFYGSTEVAWVTIATPEDLRAAPGCAGRPPFGTIVRLYDGDGARLQAPGETGRIFVGNTFPFEGYTGGGGKAVIDGLMSTGDVGHFDAGGRLFVDGRDDDMIVSGGENLFPGEVEELLFTHEAVQEAAVIGVDDDEFGKRLAAYVVLRPDRALSADDVKEFVRSNLARFKVPRDVAFLDELPRNPTGKVLKRELRERHVSNLAEQRSGLPEPMSEAVRPGASAASGLPSG